MATSLAVLTTPTSLIQPRYITLTAELTILLVLHICGPNQPRVAVIDRAYISLINKPKLVKDRLYRFLIPDTDLGF